MDPLEQLKLGIFAVFDSWMSDRAILYRDVENIQGLAGTAVTIQVTTLQCPGSVSLVRRRRDSS